MMFFTNSLTGKKEQFFPIKKDAVSMYVCGITPYDLAHLGHGRCYVTFDLVYRILTAVGYNVIYCRNFTDIDDKILKKARTELREVDRYPEISQKYIQSFLADMEKLNNINPQEQPKVTEMIPEIIRFIEGLIENKSAYTICGDVYFRVASCPTYGDLSRQNIDQLRSGARVNIDNRKESPLDFALWKSDDEIGFDSPWGKGRPGWHIECSAMIKEVFGKSIDIHGGGMDLLFPHHENERAQSRRLNKCKFVNYWIHNAFVRMNKEKMSKSLGNFATLKDVFEKFHPMVVRFYFLKQHYRNPLDFSIEDLEATEKAYKKLISVFAETEISSKTISEIIETNTIASEIFNFLKDDINSSGALGILFENLSELRKNDTSRSEVKFFVQQLLGLKLEPLEEKKIQLSDEVKQLLVDREEARNNKDWVLADSIRDKLNALDIKINDKKVS